MAGCAAARFEEFEKTLAPSLQREPTLQTLLGCIALRDERGLVALGMSKPLAAIVLRLVAYLLDCLSAQHLGHGTPNARPRPRRALSTHPEAVRKRAYRAKLRARKDPDFRDISSSAEWDIRWDVPCDGNADPDGNLAETDAPPLGTCPDEMSQPLFVKRDLKNKQTNKLPAQPVPNVPQVRQDIGLASTLADGPDAIRALLKSHQVFSGIASKTFAGTLLAEAPDVDLPTTIAAIARQIDAADIKPYNIAGYLRASVRRQQELPPSQRVRPPHQQKRSVSKTSTPPLFIPTAENPAPTKDLINLFSQLGSIVAAAPVLG